MSVVLRLDHGAGRVNLPLGRRARIRDRIADEIERLVGILDAIDGEPDDEPDLGWPEGVSGRNTLDTSDREDDAGDYREPDEDREPILGWTFAEDQDGANRFGEAWRHDEDEASRQPAVTRPPRRGAAP